MTLVGLAACASPAPRAVDFVTTAPAAAAGPAPPAVVFARAGDALVPLACGYADAQGTACLGHVAAGASLLFDDGTTVPAPTPGAPACDGRPALHVGGIGRVAVSPPADLTPAPEGVPDLGDDEAKKVRALVAQSAPDLAGPADVRQLLRTDLDGDGKPDAVYVVDAPGFHAIAGAPGMAPDLLRFLTFSDVETYEVLAAVTLGGPQTGRQLVVRATGASGIELMVLRFTGEILGTARCRPAP